MADARAFVLYADDNADDRLLLANAMRACFPEVVLECLPDGDTVVARLREIAAAGAGQLPHVVLLYSDMPRKSGLTTLAEIKSAPELARVPVVIVTRSHHGCDPEHAVSLGAAGLMRTPRSRPQMQEALTRLSTYWVAGRRALPLAG